MIDIPLRGFLLSQPAVSSVTTGIYPLRLPQSASGTNIVYDVDGGMPDLIAGGTGGVTRYGLTLNVYSPSYVTVRTLSQTLSDLLHGYEGALGSLHVTASHLITHLNTFEEDESLYRSILNLDIYTQQD